MRRILVVFAIAILPVSFAVGLVAGTAHADPHQNRLTYVLLRNDTAPVQVIILRHCGTKPQEDDMAQLNLISYDPFNNRAVFRCASH